MTDLTDAIARFRGASMGEAVNPPPKPIAVTKFADRSYVQTAHNPHYKQDEPFVVGFKSARGDWTDPQTFKTPAAAKKAHDAMVKKLARQHGGEARDTSDPKWVAKMMGTTPSRFKRR